MAATSLRRRCAPRPGLAILFDDYKLFFRSKFALEIVVAHHETYSCIEVAAYHPDWECESPRVYLNSLLIRQELPEKELEAKILEKTEILVRMREVRNPEDIRATATHEMLVNYVLSRVHILYSRAQTAADVAASQPAGSNFSITIGCSDINVEESPFVMQPPVGLQRASCTFQKKISSELYSATLTKFQDETFGLRSAISIASLIVSGVEGFQKALRERRRLEKIQAQSLYKAKFMRAIHRIVVQNEVAKMRTRLQAIEARHIVEAHNADLIARIEVERVKNPLMAKRMEKNLLTLPLVERHSIDTSLPDREEDEASFLPALLKPMRSCPNLRKDEAGAREERERRRRTRPLSGTVLSKVAAQGAGGRALSRPTSGQDSPLSEPLPSVLASYASASTQAAVPSISSAQLNHKWSVASTLPTAPR